MLSMSCDFPPFPLKISFLVTLPQTLLKEWSTKASSWMVIMVGPFFTLETTRTRALVIPCCAVPRVRAHLCKLSFAKVHNHCFISLFIFFNHSPGITFSFFWKNLEAASRFAVASGGKVISNGFSVFTNPLVGHVEIYTRGNNHRWKAKIPVPGIMNEFPCSRAQSHLSYINHWSSVRNAFFFLLQMFNFKL